MRVLEAQNELSDAAANSTKASEAEVKLVADREAALEQRCTKLESQKDGLAQALQDGQAEIAGLQVTTRTHFQLLWVGLEVCLLLVLAWSAGIRLPLSAATPLRAGNPTPKKCRPYLLLLAMTQEQLDATAEEGTASADMREHLAASLAANEELQVMKALESITLESITPLYLSRLRQICHVSDCLKGLHTDGHHVCVNRVSLLIEAERDVTVGS